MKKKDKAIFDENGVMALSYGVLNLADYMTTKKILNGGGVELNPIARFLMKKKCFGVFKTVVTLAGMLAIYGEEKPKIVSKSLLGAYGLLVAHNVKEIVQHGRETKENF